MVKKTSFSNLDPVTITFEEQRNLAQKIFDEGHEIEAFVILHGLLEIYMNNLWEIFCACQGMFYERRDELKKKDYLTLVDILYEAGLMEKKTRQQLIDFNARRNLLAHNIFGAKKKEAKKHQINTDWKKGQIASGMLPVLVIKQLHLQAKHNLKLKKKLKEEFGLSV